MLCSGILPEPRRPAACEAIFHNAQRQARLIDELLDMARIMSGKLRLERALVEPRDIVSGAIETVQPAAEAKGITIAVDLDPAVGAFYGDGARLQQVLWNLLSNAVKFTPEGGTVSAARRRGAASPARSSSPTRGRASRAISCPSSSSRSARRTARRRGCTTASAWASRSSSSSSKRTAGRSTVDSAGEGQGATFTVRLPLRAGRPVIAPAG